MQILNNRKTIVICILLWMLLPISSLEASDSAPRARHQRIIIPPPGVEIQKSWTDYEIVSLEATRNESGYICHEASVINKGNRGPRIARVSYYINSQSDTTGEGVRVCASINVPLRRGVRIEAIVNQRKVIPEINGRNNSCVLILLPRQTSGRIECRY